jgi:hypothetical protein
MNADGTEPIIAGEHEIIDSRDVIARIAYLRAEWAEATGNEPDDYALSGDDWKVGLGDEEGEEMVALLELAQEGEANLADWAYGETLVEDYSFEGYAQELAEDIGLYNASEAQWPLTCIDWAQAARELQMDYTALSFGSHVYWGRS